MKDYSMCIDKKIIDNASLLINNDAETIPLLDRELIQMIDKYEDPEEFKQAYLKRTDPNEPNPYAGIVFPYRKVAKRFEETHTTTQT